MSVHVLFDSRAAHLFVVIGGNWGGNPCKKDNEFVISTPLGKTVNINHMYKRVQFVINKCELKVDLLPLELHNFDVILGMDWLSMNKTQINFLQK